MQLSVGTPSFPSSRWLRPGVASVADQGLPMAHIVQHAGSDDGTLDWLLPDRRVQTFVEKDVVQYDAINCGRRRATGDIFAYLNCDEQYLSGMLAAVVEFFNPCLQRSPSSWHWLPPAGRCRPISGNTVQAAVMQLEIAPRATSYPGKCLPFVSILKPLIHRVGAVLDVGESSRLGGPLGLKARRDAGPTARELRRCRHSRRAARVAVSEPDANRDRLRSNSEGPPPEPLLGGGGL